MSKINLIDLQKRKLQASYLAWFVFAKNIKARLSTCIENQTLYCIYGIDKLGNRQVLGMFFENDKDNRFWLEIFEDFKARNAQNVLFIVTPKISKTLIFHAICGIIYIDLGKRKRRYLEEKICIMKKYLISI